MTDSNLIELAKLGDPQAIAALMNQSLESRGMRATVDRQGDCLEVMLEAERIPNRQSLTAFVQKGIDNLGIQSISSIRILGQQFGASYPAWMQELHLDTSPDAEIGTASLPIQSETAIDSSRIPDEPATPLEGDDFSVTDSIDASSLVESGQVPDSSAELNELWTPESEPNFLQELLATEATSSGGISDDQPAGLLHQDEGLIDFLSDLSGEPAHEEFPAEVAQEQSSFMAGSGAAGAMNLQDLFAESDDQAAEGGMPWEDSVEPIAAGEPDADLLDFLKTPDDRSTTEALNLDEQILTEYPDAASIDQLPEELLSELDEPEVPLQEPSEDFLSTLLGEPIDSPAPELLPDAIENQPEPFIKDPDSQPLPEPLAEPLLQDPWVSELEDVPAVYDRPDFPEDSSSELTPFLAEPTAEETEMEEALPDFLVDPLLDLPVADPAEMTLTELEQQPEVLDAAVEESIETPSQFPQDELEAESSPLIADRFEDEAASHSLDEALPGDSAWEPDLSEQPAILEVGTETAPPGIPLPASPDAALLSNFADSQTESQTDAAFWTEESEDEVEEIPPDFLREMQDWPALDAEGPSAIGPTEIETATVAELPELEPTEIETATVAELSELEPSSAPDPEWAALEAKLSALDLSSDDAAPAVERDREPSDGQADDQDVPIDLTGLELIEPLSETPEGTAIEPPADWVAAAVPTNLWAEPLAEVPASIEPDAANSERVESAAENDGNGSAQATPAPIPDLSQDELEAGLGDFRAGFVEPLPPEFFEEDEPQTGYSDWQADLGDPLSLDEEDDETGYIIEDNTPAVEYVPPSLPLQTEDRATDTTSENASNPFILVLFALFALLGMLGGFILFKSRLSPNPSNVPPPAEPPASETPAPASPTSANPTSPIASQEDPSKLING